MASNALNYVMQDAGNLNAAALTGAAIEGVGKQHTPDMHVLQSNKNVRITDMGNIIATHFAGVGSPDKVEALSKFKNANYAVELAGVTGVNAGKQRGTNTELSL